MAVAMLLIPLGDGTAKHVQTITPYSPSFLSWSRFSLAALCVLPFALYAQQIPPPTPQHRIFWSRQITRGLLIAITVTLITKAVGLSPLADVFGAFFIGPGISVILAQVILRVRASRGELAAGACYGAFLVATRWAAGSGTAIGQLSAQLGVAALCLTPLGLPDLVNHGVQAAGWIVASSLFSATANLLSIIAFARVANAKLAPVVYLQVLSATFIGIIAFGDTPNNWTAAGLLLIVITGLVQALVNHNSDKRLLK